MHEKCLGQNPDCSVPNKKRCSVGHHLWYPSSEYVTDLEVAFRNLTENVVQRCVCVERADPHTTPLKKPHPVQMLNALREDHGRA